MQLRTRKLMTTHGISDELLHHSFNYQIDAPRLGEGLEDTLREKMQDIPGLRLIVIDVLARIRPSRQGNQSVYDGDYAVGAALKAVAADFPDLAILVVHHARKGEGDALESVSGSYGLSGGVDNVFTMMNGTGGMALHINGRDIENSSEIPLTKDEAGMWTLESRQAAREAQRSETRTAILNALKAGASTPRDIASETGIGANTVQQQLLRMQKAGDVAKTGWGKYDLANPDPTRLAAKNRTSSE
jgi:hypothetical protein